MKIINRLAWVTVGFTFILVALGGTVRATNSGLSCPDWPLCFGRPYAPFNLNAQLEETHRYVAGIVSILIALLLISALLWARQNRRVLIPALIAPVFLIIQIVLGGLTVIWDLPPQIIAAHLGTALIIFALMITIAVMSGKALPGSKELPEKTRQFTRLAVTNAILLYGLLLSGSYVVGSSASLACSSWPLCGTPAEGAVQYHLTDIDLFHRYVAFFIGLVMLWTIIAALRRRKYAPGQAIVAVTGGVLFICQSGIGALIVFLKKPDWAAALHLGTASAVWGFMVLLAVMAARQLSNAPTGDELEQLREEFASKHRKEPGPVQQAIAGYVNLMKPHVTVLLLGTTVAAMVIAKQGLPSLSLILATLVGGAMAAGSANSINCYIDRDIDQIMSRTQRRSLPAGRVQPTQALLFGLFLGAGSCLIFSLFVNLLSAGLALTAILFYILIYTLWLKRSSAQNIVIGGAAGAFPVLIGWAAVTNSLSLPAIWLFAIIFYWTPPHFWALSLLIEKDYAKANIPMLPVVMGEHETKKQILLYSLMLLAVTLVLFAMQAMGSFYLVCAIILGGILVYMAVRLILDQSRKWARTIFWYSNCYLALIFAVMVLDRVIH